MLNIKTLKKIIIFLVFLKKKKLRLHKPTYVNVCMFILNTQWSHLLHLREKARIFIFSTNFYVFRTLFFHAITRNKMTLWIGNFKMLESDYYIELQAISASLMKKSVREKLEREKRIRKSNRATSEPRS